MASLIWCHGQMGYGLGGHFRSIVRAVMPMIKTGRKPWGLLFRFKFSGGCLCR